jgi:hypothetical protein
MKIPTLSVEESLDHRPDVSLAAERLPAHPSREDRMASPKSRRHDEQGDVI